MRNPYVPTVELPMFVNGAPASGVTVRVSVSTLLASSVRRRVKNWIRGLGEWRVTKGPQEGGYDELHAFANANASCDLAVDLATEALDVAQNTAHLAMLVLRGDLDLDRVRSDHPWIRGVVEFELAARIAAAADPDTAASLDEARARLIDKFEQAKKAAAHNLSEHRRAIAPDGAFDIQRRLLIAGVRKMAASVIAFHCTSYNTDDELRAVAAATAEDAEATIRGLHAQKKKV